MARGPYRQLTKTMFHTGRYVAKPRPFCPSVFQSIEEMLGGVLPLSARVAGAWGFLVGLRELFQGGLRLEIELYGNALPVAN
jgi:hypothetical protein